MENATVTGEEVSEPRIPAHAPLAPANRVWEGDFSDTEAVGDEKTAIEIASLRIVSVKGPEPRVQSDAA